MIVKFSFILFIAKFLKILQINIKKAKIIMKETIKINGIDYVSFNITADDVIYIPRKLEKKMEYFGCLDYMEKARITQLTFTIK